MRPRILLRTHYQANEPRLVIATIRFSSPTESRNEDKIAAMLERWARENDYTLSTPAAIYAVGNARHLGLLNKSNRWTASGLAFAFLERLIPPLDGQQSRILTPVEERLYLKLYLTGAGALLIKFGKWLLVRGFATDEHLRAESVFEILLKEALDEYLRLATDIRDRAAIRRERERLRETDYAASTKRHKRYPLITTMVRLRLLHQITENVETATIKPDTGGRLEALTKAIPDVETLERLIRDNKLQETLDIAMGEYARRDLPAGQEAHVLVLQAYRFAIESGMQACPLSFLNDVLGAVFPSSQEAQQPQAEKILELAHRQYPGEVRFHVDRRGQRAFVLISEKALSHLNNI